jgi:RNA polymerase sigma factor (sigma-70 family)
MVFFKVFSSLKNFDESKDLKQWMRTIFVNTSIDYYRKNKREPLLEPVDGLNENELISETEDKLSVKEILALFDKLPEAQRVVFNLHEVEGYKHAEIAKLLQIDEATSRSYLKRARQKLRELYKQNNANEYERAIR